MLCFIEEILLGRFQVRNLSIKSHTQHSACESDIPVKQTTKRRISGKHPPPKQAHKRAQVSLYIATKKQRFQEEEAGLV